MKTPINAQETSTLPTFSGTEEHEMNSNTRIEADRVVITLSTSSSFEVWALCMKSFTSLARLLTEPAMMELLQNKELDLQGLTQIGLALSELDSSTIVKAGESFR